MDFAVNIAVERGDNRVVVTGEVVGPDGQVVPISWPVVIVNPPELVPDGAGGFRRDPDEAVRQTVLALAREVC